ncbi:MAG: alpha/beta hydrolase, partial [Acidimicrobiales bacterium]
MSFLNEVKRHNVDAFGYRMHVAEMGEGPLVLFVHGFPESWYSWRNQLPALAAA